MDKDKNNFWSASSDHIWTNNVPNLYLHSKNNTSNNFIDKLSI